MEVELGEAVDSPLAAIFVISVFGPPSITFS
jgi:hypothetical protein